MNLWSQGLRKGDEDRTYTSIWDMALFTFLSNVAVLLYLNLLLDYYLALTKILKFLWMVEKIECHC